MGHGGAQPFQRTGGGLLAYPLLDADFTHTALVHGDRFTLTADFSARDGYRLAVAPRT